MYRVGLVARPRRHVRVAHDPMHLREFPDLRRPLIGRRAELRELVLESGLLRVIGELGERDAVLGPEFRYGCRAGIRSRSRAGASSLVVESDFVPHPLSANTALATHNTSRRTNLPMTKALRVIRMRN